MMSSRNPDWFIQNKGEYFAPLHGAVECNSFSTLCGDVSVSYTHLDGVGFKEEELNSPESIGIKNVENRISLWGPDIRLYIYRIDGRTIQVLIVPFKEEKHEDTGDRR